MMTGYLPYLALRQGKRFVDGLTREALLSVLIHQAQLLANGVLRRPNTGV